MIFERMSKVYTIFQD